MNYLSYNKCDTANGEGVRCSLFVSGCKMQCVGCWNKESWKFNAGTQYTQEFEDGIIEDLRSSYISGISLLGGNPTEGRNAQTLIELCQRIRTECPDKTIWIWSGHTFEELISNTTQKELISLCDVLIDDRFIKELHFKALKWRGSSNQRVIDIQKSLDVGTVVLYDEFN